MDQRHSSSHVACSKGRLMQTRASRVAITLLGLLIMVLAPSHVAAYVEAPHSLGMVVNLSTNVILVKVDKVDKQNNTIIYTKVRDIKGKHATMFHNGQQSETCIGTYWYQCAAVDEWWNMTHGEPFLLRTYAGNIDKLAAAVAEMLNEKEVIVPCMVDGNKDDLHLRRAKIERLRASLKLDDYNEKRDFVGFGGEDFRRIFAMPGFTHYSAVNRVDPRSEER